MLVCLNEPHQVLVVQNLHEVDLRGDVLQCACRVHLADDLDGHRRAVRARLGDKYFTKTAANENGGDDDLWVGERMKWIRTTNARKRMCVGDGERERERERERANEYKEMQEKE